MANRKLLFGSAAREKVLRGASALADAVRVTLGPRSKSVLIERAWGRPLVCNDGVTIAKEMSLEDREENLGAQMMREAAERTGEAVGDGTSTSTVLAHAIFADGAAAVVGARDLTPRPPSLQGKGENESRLLSSSPPRFGEGWRPSSVSLCPTRSAARSRRRRRRASPRPVRSRGRCGRRG